MARPDNSEDYVRYVTEEDLTGYVCQGLLERQEPSARLAFAAFGIAFASIPTRSVGNIMMPSTLVRWPLMFLSGIFIPLVEMAAWAWVLAYLSPLTYAQDLMNHAD